MEIVAAIEGFCWFCDVGCVEDEYCSGCCIFICEYCMEVLVEDLENVHEPEDHQINSYYDDSEEEDDDLEEERYGDCLG